MKKTIIFIEKFRGREQGSELTLPAPQAKVIVEILGKATYKDKAIKESPVVKVPPLPTAPVAPIVPPVVPSAPAMPTSIPPSFPIVNGKKEGSEKTTLSRKGPRNQGSASTEKDE